MSLLETLTALVIVAIVGGVVISRTAAPRGTGEAVAVVQTLYGVSEAVTAYRSTVGRYPSMVADLVQPPAVALDLCQREIPAHFLAEWRGPYLVRRVTTDGIPIGEATLANRIRREPQTLVGSPAGTLLLDIAGVERDLAIRVNRAMEDNEDLATGMIRWVPTNGEIGTLTFGMPIRGC